MVFCLAVCCLVSSVAFGEEAVVLSRDRVKDLIEKGVFTTVNYRFSRTGVEFSLPASWTVSEFIEKEMSYFEVRISSPDGKVTFFCVETPNQRKYISNVLNSIGAFTEKVLSKTQFLDPQNVKFNGIKASKMFSNGIVRGKPSFANLHQIETDGKYILSIFVIGEYDSANTVNKDALKMFADTLAKLSPDKEPAPKNIKGNAPSKKPEVGKKNVDNSDFQ